jgi:hypothetical protein
MPPARDKWDTKWSDMEGEVLVDIHMAGDAVQVVTDKGTWTWTPYGDCCANAFINDFPSESDIAAMRGKTILHAVTRDGGHAEDDAFDVADWHFYDIQTSAGDVTLELRVEHNGYYGGQLDFTSFEPVS